MRRNINRLCDNEFDVLVIGGGAAGAAAAREACLYGFSTALIEKNDFGSGTSAHCFKVVHGGIRYLQHADFSRMRASCRERSVFLRIAPHLVAPLPFAIPTYGRGRSSRWLLNAGMLMYDTLTASCNTHVLDPARRVQRSRLLGREQVLHLFPGLERAHLTGAAVFEDGQMYNPPRLVLAFIAAADTLGAVVANHVEAERLLLDGTRVIGVAARDTLDGSRLEIRARLVINAAGPWAEGLLQGLEPRPVVNGTYSRDACMVVARRPQVRMALAVQGSTRDGDAVLGRATRHMFLVPWRSSTLVGVWHSVVARAPDQTSLSEAELGQFIGEINHCHPGLRLRRDEVRICGFGLVPFGDADRQRPGELSFGKQSRIIDHRAQGTQGLISLISVRYTVARRDAAAALQLAARQLGRELGASDSDIQPLAGGDIDDLRRFRQQLRKSAPEWLGEASRTSLASNYGTHAARVIALAEREPELRRCLTGTHLLLAEVAYAVREEMAQHLSDVVFRRTELGTDGHPGAAALAEAHEFMRRECGWSARRAADEQAATERHFERYLAAPAAATAMSVRSA